MTVSTFLVVEVVLVVVFPSVFLGVVAVVVVEDEEELLVGGVDDVEVVVVVFFITNGLRVN